jgi:hypothetical protein
MSKYGSVDTLLTSLYMVHTSLTPLFSPQKRRHEAPAPNIYIHALSSRFSSFNHPARIRSLLGADYGLLDNHRLQILPL